jgi:hypothetical protein
LKIVLASEKLGIAFGAGMDRRVEALLQLVPAHDLAIVAASASGNANARLIGVPAASDIVSAHTDARTLGIVRLCAQAEAAGPPFAWSAVAKLIDLNIPPGPTNTWIRPENEVAFYAGRSFADDGLAFRPARCYFISHPTPGVAVLWLEDLTGAATTPFSLDQLGQIVRHLGQWNGHHFGGSPELGFMLGRDSIARRWREWPHDADLADFQSMRHSPAVTALYRLNSLELPFALRGALLACNARAVTHQHTLCFGDCNVGNLFCLPGETVGIDWASLSIDPLGVDAGSVIGSACSWGREAAAVARNERGLFELYLMGLTDAGWRGDRDDVRRGYLLHFGFYLLSTAILPAFTKHFPRSMAERRRGMPFDEIWAHDAPIIDLLPGFIDELQALA